jgi:hypothetical protein
MDFKAKCILLLFVNLWLLANAFIILKPSKRPVNWHGKSSRKECFRSGLSMASFSETIQSVVATHGPISAEATNEVTGVLSSQQTVIVFLIGLVPFLVATFEFWRRIAVGATFGTGADSIVIIGENDVPTSSRGRRVLGKGALAVAYLLFVIAFGVLGIVLYSVMSSSPPPPQL